MPTATDLLVNARQKIKKVSKQDFPKLLVDDVCVFCTPPNEKVFLETENFYVTYDASPLAEGHLLIHTKDHMGCTAEVGADMYGELVSLKEEIGAMLEAIYGYACFYEHGRAGHCSIMIGDQICHHFHLHALPVKAKVNEVMAKRFRGIKMDDFAQMPELYEQYGTYLFFENADHEQYFFPAKDGLEPHYLRTTISDALGTPERADYKFYTNLDEINNFIDKAKAHLNAN